MHTAVNGTNSFIIGITTGFLGVGLLIALRTASPSSAYAEELPPPQVPANLCCHRDIDYTGLPSCETNKRYQNGPLGDYVCTYRAACPTGQVLNLVPNTVCDLIFTSGSSSILNGEELCPQTLAAGGREYTCIVPPIAR